MRVTAEKVTELIPIAAKVGISTMLHGDPGIGKSDIIRAIAKQYKLFLIDVRMSTYDPVDLNGFPRIDTDTAEYVPFDTFPLAKRDKPPAGYVGWLIFLDEFNSAPRSVQAACYKLILDRELGNHKLHKNVWIVCAGNLVTSGAIVSPLGTAMKSRLVHYELTILPETWLKWGSKNKLDHRILAYINHRPDNLQVFDPSTDDHTFACPRTWHFVSKMISGVATSGLVDLLPLIAGTIGEGIAREFVAFTEIYSNLSSYQDIISDPKGSRVHKEPSMLYATAHMIAAYTHKNDLAKAMEYIERLPIEFQVITLQGAIQRDPALIYHKTVVDFMGVHGSNIFA